jgi:hypothetical protein
VQIHRRTLYKAQAACKMVCEARKSFCYFNPTTFQLAY